MEQQKDCKYTAPVSNPAFIGEYTPFIKKIIYGFDWGGVRHVATAQADDTYQDLMLSWVAGNYLGVYDSSSSYLNPRTGKHVRCTFRNFVYQFTVRRLFNWRDQFNRQVYQIKTECVVADPNDKACAMEVNGVRYVYRKKFLRNVSMQELLYDEDREFLFEDGAKSPADSIADKDNLKRRCEFVYRELGKMRVVSKRDYAKLFLFIVRMSCERGKGVLQADLAVEFDVSASTISLMVKQMRSIPVIREFRQTVENDLICK